MVNQPTRTPLLSIVVPVYGVEAYLPQCLDSIHADIPAGEAAAVEVVAVDDASPDGCGQLLREYAADHPGVRVLHLSKNVGLGLARNAGLDAATGRYVWFVDSDDWLPPGTIPAVLDRLRTDRPDVMMIDHLRVHECGRREVDVSSRLLRGTPGVVRLADRPQLLRVQHTAWNKVVRREFMAELGLRFHPGWYEDIPFSHPLLIGAERISVLDEVCYLYRQGRQGAITSTRSGRHFDAFEQYDRLFAWLRQRHPDGRWHAELFDLMVNHFLVVVGNDDRLHPHLRRSFFRRVAGHYRRYLPGGGYPRPGGVAGLKHRLVGQDSYLAYAALRRAHRLAGRLRSPAATSTSTDGADTAPDPTSESRTLVRTQGNGSE
ncbi:CDP-glycerol--glycerophosphate glycerophosphotransferase [Micromonospora craterilacus]|uniref:CDP-glycerol--glycerophosphate glycerophosphotransferase n=1 Tax=Micromonospora craterilacus TaxID=1655439 RepID=A0A2W2EGA6_9ACTN|nr:glycosyltransferase [Micromonospora craterilacus]PZG23376.1 CDP-glycerol--glycerophosphate glycerophosphotransferase [Micromonospora craterilacus]